MARKKTNDLKKRKQKAAEKRNKKRQDARRKAASSNLAYDNEDYFEEDLHDDFEGPDELSLVPLSEAISTFSYPLYYALAGKLDKGKQDIVYELVARIWGNAWALCFQDGTSFDEASELHAKIEEYTGFDKFEAELLVHRMSTFFEWLFPEYFSPEADELIQMSKDIAYPNRNLEGVVFVPMNHDEDVAFTERCRELFEKLSASEKERDEIEEAGSVFHDLIELLCSEFSAWAHELEVGQFEYDHVLISEIFTRFCYFEAKLACLKDCSPDLLLKFFGEYVVHRLRILPPEYLLWVESIKLFFCFLVQYGYCEFRKDLFETLNQERKRFMKGEVYSFMLED